MRRSLPMLLLSGLALSSLVAQEQEEAPPAAEEKPAAKPVEIAEEPTTIDPSTLMPPALAKKATVQFTDATLKEVAKWLQEEQDLSVLINQQEIIGDGGSINDPITDRLDDEPIYLLLNRLKSQELDWYMEDNVLRITTLAKAQEHMDTVPYLIGDLLDEGFKPGRLMSAIRNCTAGEWEVDEGVGGRMVLLGDVLFVRQPAHIHREIQGLLTALRSPARRTIIGDEPSHEVLRSRLQQPATINVQDKPLATSVAELSKTAEIEIRLDKRALRELQVRERTLVTAKMENQKLTTVLQALVGEWDLTWKIEDGVLWLTSPDRAQHTDQLSVLDVRDLCQDDRESLALQRAIYNQTSGEWADEGSGGGRLSFVKAGILVIRQSERVQQETFQLLENYRIALRASKPRVNKDLTSKEMVTVFYRLPTNVADDLEPLLATLVRPETWEAEGVSIRKLVSRSESVNNVLVPYSVLIVRQMREVHQELGAFLEKVQSGEAAQLVMGGMGGGIGGMGAGAGGGMGGFGGGFFSLPGAAE